MTKKPKQRVRGSQTGRPIMLLFDVLGRRWTLRILWELRAGTMTFRELQSRCDDVSPTVLNARVKELRELKILTRDESGYTYTKWGRQLGEHLLVLSDWSKKWGKDLEPLGHR